MHTLGPHWHVGVIVEDLDRAMLEMSASLGVEWCSPQTRVGDQGKFRLTFSTTTPYFELIEGIPGSDRDSSAGPHIDHLAYWSNDYSDDKERLTCAGFALELEGSAPFGGEWCYMRGSSSGLRVELCEATSRAGFFRRWNLPLDEEATR